MTESIIFKAEPNTR